MSKAVQALLSGIFFTFILDFFLFLGIKLHYTDENSVGVYYNILFADHQNIFVFITFSILLGYITIYLSNKIALAILGTLFALSLSTLIFSIGNQVGKIMLMKNNVLLQTKKYTYTGDIIYNGRKEVTFYDYKLKKVLTFDKKNLKGDY
ncbi:hypothetical protein GJV85_04780 [Sulfurimonas aquatica]|uniref:Uncharacterized protein n=1 Tax=Sulfurimonas aquatica TaxID=2672570 RepID=A0A975GCB5_9BACT|nr:hypothetical protein [Sulfurimonas aquatica]QSZ41450.1 hypothetical protein GJV85_04780 [Sulfurimonas aquatica]